MALEIISGYSTLFQQTTPPINWTKVTTYNDYTLRVVTGATSSGGSISFTSNFNTKTVSLPGTPTGSIGPVALTLSQIAPHVHQYYYSSSSGSRGSPGGSPLYTPGASGTRGPTGDVSSPSMYSSITPYPSPTGAATEHTHPSGDISFSWSQSGSLDLRIKYVDMIIATRN